MAKRWFRQTTRKRLTLRDLEENKLPGRMPQGGIRGQWHLLVGEPILYWHIQSQAACGFIVVKTKHRQTTETPTGRICEKCQNAAARN